MYLGAELKRLHVVPLKHPVPEGMEEPKRSLQPTEQSESAAPSLPQPTCEQPSKDTLSQPILTLPNQAIGDFSSRLEPATQP